MMPATIGIVPTYRFLNTRQLERHFTLHGAEFGAANAQAYEDMADAFWGTPIASHIHECTRKNGDVIRFNANTDGCSVMDAKKVIRTFFKPVPCNSIPLTDRDLAVRTGRCHGEPNNLLYFQKECRQ